jgi:hypothetical protein
MFLRLLIPCFYPTARIDGKTIEMLGKNRTNREE